jgi:quercetin dioxygenase-like cupin family protein
MALWKERWMKTIKIDPNLAFPEKTPHAAPLHVGESGRALLFTLRAGETIEEHRAPSSPLFIYVLRGRGEFSGADGKPAAFGPGALLIFKSGEDHRVQALEDLAFLGIMQPVPEEITR